MFKHKTRSAGEESPRYKSPKKGPIGPFLGLFDYFIPAIESSCDHCGPFAGKPAPTGIEVAADDWQYTDTVGAAVRRFDLPAKASALTTQFSRFINLSVTIHLSA
jgi:hypothetical protein